MSAIGDAWALQRERENPIPNSVARLLPQFDEQRAARALGMLAGRITAIDDRTLRVECWARPGAVRLDLQTLAWRSIPGGVEGEGFLELAAYMRRSNLLRAAGFLYSVPPLEGACS